MQKLLNILSYLAVAVLVGYTISYAGSLTPPGSVADTMYSLTDIFNLSTGTTTTEDSGTIPSTPGTVTASGKSLTEVYTAIAGEIDNLTNGRIASGISAFGFTGTLYGDTDASKVLTTATYPGTIATRTLSASNDTVSAGYYAATTLSTVDTDLTAANILSGTTIFGVAGSASAGGLPKTGQTLCYNTDGSAQSPCLDGSNTDGGQDGYYQAGTAPAYTDNGDATITDNATGLMWKKCSQGKTGATCATGTNDGFTWRNALAACEADTTGSHTDWRLPNMKELLSILNFEDGSFGPMLHSTFDAPNGFADYWSSTTYHGSPYYDYVWYVDFRYGTFDSALKTVSSKLVRCVR